MIPYCFGLFEDYDDYCWYYCPYSWECEDETYYFYQDDYWW